MCTCLLTSSHKWGFHWWGISLSLSQDALLYLTVRALGEAEAVVLEVVDRDGDWVPGGGPQS